jgi:hypothetical protein
MEKFMEIEAFALRCGGRYRVLLSSHEIEDGRRVSRVAEQSPAISFDEAAEALDAGIASIRDGISPAARPSYSISVKTVSAGRLAIVSLYRLPTFGRRVA